MKRFQLFAFLLGVCASVAATGSMAQDDADAGGNPARSAVNASYVPLGRANGALYRPASGTPHTAFILMHRTASFLRHVGCGELSDRGFLVLCMEPSAVDNEAIVNWDQTMLDIRAGVEFLRKQPGINRVVLFGHSGGGAVMASYQAIAEKGSAYCRAPGKIQPCSDRVANLPAADAVVFADSHPSDGIMLMRDLNPSVKVDKDGAISIDPALDPFSPANGFSPAGSHYSKEFYTRYFAAQAAQLNALLDKAQAQISDAKAHGFVRANQDVVMFPTTRASGWLPRWDAGIPGTRSTVRPEKLLKNDGSVATQVVTTVATTTAPNDLKTLQTRYWTTTSLVGAHAVRARDSQVDLDYCSTNSSSICAAQFVSVPVLVAGMGGYMFVVDSERLFDHTASKDKDFIVVEGALHGINECKACEKEPGQYKNSTKNFFDYVRDWTNKRFPG
jgi:pimeloyl-ACP methyl ester carboxylesterase